MYWGKIITECLTLGPYLHARMLPWTILYLDQESNVFTRDYHEYENVIFIELINSNLGNVM